MADSAVGLADWNASIFFDSGLADWYARQPLMAPEAMILIRWREAYAGRRVLDLGVGSGRTTRYLAPLARRYVGIDVSEPMLALARREAPAAEFLSLDLRALATLPPGTFDFIFGPYNVLDALDHDSREQAVRDCRALLADGGMLVFSAHNRNHVDAGRPPRRPSGRGLVRNLLDVRHYAVAMTNYWRLRGLRREETEYALFNDISHAWKGVFYYVSRQAQVRLLAGAGFETLEVLGEDGRALPPGADDRGHGCLHYVCRKL